MTRCLGSVYGVCERRRIDSTLTSRPVKELFSPSNQPGVPEFIAIVAVSAVEQGVFGGTEFLAYPRSRMGRRFG